MANDPSYPRAKRLLFEAEQAGYLNQPREAVQAKARADIVRKIDRQTPAAKSDHVKHLEALRLAEPPKLRAEPSVWIPYESQEAPMGLLLLIHVSAGLAGLITGTIALSVRKGGPLHRRIGLLYVYVMVVMGLTGAAIAALELASGVRKPGLEATALMGLFSAYLVVTGLTTIRPPGTWSRRLDLLGLPFAASIGIAQLTLGIQAIIHPESRAIGMVTAVELIFGTIALVAVGSDLQIIRSVPLTGVKRIARHLWRMTVALLFAGFAFLPRLTKFMPTPFGPIVMAPVLAVLVTLIYWMWRIRLRKSSRGLIGVAPLCQRE